MYSSSVKKMLLSCLLCAAIGFSSWSLLLSHQKHEKSDLLTNEPDAFMEHAVAIILNKTGTPSLKISSPKMIHYKKNDTTHIVNPEVIVYRNSPEPWHVNANYATATQGTEKIVFSEHVIIYHAADAAASQTTLNTDSLTILPNLQQAKTADPVTILQPSAKVYGTGMLADLKLGTIQLLSQTRSEYVSGS